MSHEKRLESLWRKLLDSTNIQDNTLKANVLVVGNEKSGKKSLINAILSSLNQSNDIENFNEMAFLGDSKKKNEHVYLMDYKYVRINEFPEEDSEELGKINFYIMNRKYEHFHKLLTEEILRNLMVVIVLDLDDPSSLTESFIEWINFISNKIMAYISELAPEIREIMEENFEAAAIKNKLIFQPGSEADLEYEEPIDVTFSLKIPLLILANKSDALDKLTEQKALDFVQHKLRTLAVRYGASLMYVSPKLNQNIDTFVNYISYTMLNNKNVKLEVDLSNEKLFVPFSFDQLDILNEHFKDCEDYTFSHTDRKTTIQEEGRKEDGHDIMSMQDFLKNLKEGTASYGTESKEPVRTETEPQTRSSVFKQNPTKRLLDILERKKKKE